MKESIYQLLSKAVNAKGRLDPEFSLPEEGLDDGISWAPGAMDGVMLYHMERPEEDPEDEGYKALTRIIDLASADHVNEALKEAEAFAADTAVFPYADEILRYVVQNQRDLEASNIVRLSYRLITEGTLKEAVKLGLILLELFVTGQDDFLRTPFRILGLYDEFTLYAAFNMMNWDNGNEELFNLVQKVEGWGRIHLVRLLEADTEEKKMWLLKHGAHNQVVAAYSGLDCYRKTDFLEHLKRPVTYEVYRGMSDIISALLDEGPVAGLEVIEEKEEVVGLFLQATAARDDLKAPDYATIFELIDYLSDEENGMTALLPQAEALIDERAKAAVEEELKQGKYFGIAKRMGLAYEPYAYDAVMKDLEQNAWWAGDLIKHNYRAEELLSYIEAYLNLGEPSRPAEDQREEWMPGIYDYVLQAIRQKPGAGERFVAAGLTSDKRRIQNGSVKVLQCWLEETGKSLGEISPGLQLRLAEAAADEEDPQLQEEMYEILRQG